MQQNSDRRFGSRISIKFGKKLLTYWTRLRKDIQHNDTQHDNKKRDTQHKCYSE